MSGIHLEFIPLPNAIVNHDQMHILRIFKVLTIQNVLYISLAEITVSEEACYSPISPLVPPL